jgi:hypothetical protein
MIREMSGIDKLVNTTALRRRNLLRGLISACRTIVQHSVLHLYQRHKSNCSLSRDRWLRDLTSHTDIAYHDS